MMQSIRDGSGQSHKDRGFVIRVDGDSQRRRTSRNTRRANRSDVEALLLKRFCGSQGSFVFAHDHWHDAPLPPAIIPRIASSFRKRLAFSWSRFRA